MKLSYPPVNLVHVGVAMTARLPDDFDMDSGELDKLVNRRLLSIEEIQEQSELLEGWSRIFFDNYLKNTSLGSNAS